MKLLSEIESLINLKKLEDKLRLSMIKKYGRNGQEFDPFSVVIGSSLELKYQERLLRIRPDQKIIENLDDLMAIKSIKGIKVKGKLPFFDLIDDFPSEEKELQIISGEIRKALEIINSTTPYYQLLLNFFLIHIIPLNEHNHNLGQGATSSILRGVIFIGPSKSIKDPFIISLGIIHEVIHLIFYLIQFSDPMLKSNEKEMVYSPIRQTNRPAIYAFHAFVVLANMYKFIEISFEEDVCAEQLMNEKAKILEMALATYKSISCLEFTSVGRKLLRECYSFL